MNRFGLWLFKSRYSVFSLIILMLFVHLVQGDQFFAGVVALILGALLDVLIEGALIKSQKREGP